MTTFQDIAALDCDGENVHLIVDANSLFVTQRQLLGRGPGPNDKIDIARVANLVAQRSRETLDPDYFDLERGGGAANPFYFMLEQVGFRLQLTPRQVSYGTDWQENLGRVIHRLRELHGCRCAVYYVAGRMRHEIQSALLELASQDRDVWLMLLGQNPGFQSHELDRFAGSFDLVGIKAAGRHFYHEPPESSWAAPTPDRWSENERSPIASPETSDDSDRDGAIGHAPRRDVPEFLDRAESDPRGSDEVPRESLPEPTQEFEPDTDSQPEAPLVVIDSVLADLVEAHSLNSETRTSRSKLLEWFTALADTEDAVVFPILQAAPRSRDFVESLESAGSRPLHIKPDRARSVVDEAALMLLGAMQSRCGDIIVVTNDGEFYEALEALRTNPDGSERSIAVAGLVDRMSQRYIDADWIQVLDLERDLCLFGYDLPNRYLPIPLADFDAVALLDECGLFEEDDGTEAA